MRTKITLPCALAAAFCWMGFFRPSAAEAHIIICNQGDVQLHVAGYERFLLIPLSGYIEAWRIVEPGACTDINSRRDTAVNLVFALRTPDGEFGIVKYRTQEYLDAHYRYVESYCVTPEPMREEGEGVNKYLPPCAAGYVAAPTTVGVLIQSGATMTLNLKPTAADFDNFVAIVQRGSRPNKSGARPARQKAVGRAATPAEVKPVESPSSKMTAACRRSHYDAAVAGKYMDRWSDNETREWCSCLTDNLQPILTPDEQIDYMRNAAAFIGTVLEDPTSEKPRNWRLYTPIGNCRH